jgi:hypothetical protein
LVPALPPLEPPRPAIGALADPAPPPATGIAVEPPIAVIALPEPATLPAAEPPLPPGAMPSGIDFAGVSFDPHAMAKHAIAIRGVGSNQCPRSIVHSSYCAMQFATMASQIC